MQRPAETTGPRASGVTDWSDHLRESQRLRGAIYVALKVLGDQAAAAELKIYRWHPDARMDGDRAAREPLEAGHRLAKILKRPNVKETGGMLRRKTVHQMGLTGTSLWWRVDNGFDTPEELWSIPTGTYQPIAPSVVYPHGAYRIMPWFPGPLALVPGTWNAGGVVVPADQMVVCRHPHPLVQHEGLSPLEACSLPLDTIESIDRARFSRMRNQMTPSAVVEADPNVIFPEGDDLTALRAEIRALLGGPDKAGEAALLSPGLTAKPWGESEIEVGWIDSWAQLVGFVLAIFGTNKSMCFLEEDTSYAELFARLKQFNLFSLCPLLSMIADSININLTWPFWGDEFFVEIEPQSVTDDDQMDKKIARLASVGGTTVNEIRVMLGLEPIEEEWGEERAFMGKPQERAGAGEGYENSAGPEVEGGRPGSRPAAGSAPGAPLRPGQCLPGQTAANSGCSPEKSLRNGVHK